MARIELSAERRDLVLRKLSRYLRDELDREASNLELGFLLDFLSDALGPVYYNQGVHDAQTLFQSKLEDAVYEIEKPFQD